MDLSKLTDYQFWFAQYSDAPSCFYDFQFWQYSSKGKVAGLGGLPQRFQPAPGPCRMGAVLFEVDAAAKRCVGVKRVDLAE